MEQLNTKKFYTNKNCEIKRTRNVRFSFLSYVSFPLNQTELVYNEKILQNFLEKNKNTHTDRCVRSNYVIHALQIKLSIKHV